MTGLSLPGRAALALALLVVVLPLAVRAEAPPRAVLLPLDDRPSTLLFPRQVARIGGGELACPPRSLLGNLTTPGRCDELGRWLPTACEQAETAIISTDMLCYGGLVASRSIAATEKEALARLEVLRGLGRPGLRLEMLATIPRLDLRTSDRQAPYRGVMQRWAATGTLKPPADVPADLVQEYLSVRRRNQRVLMALLALAKEGVVDRVVIGQDDSSPRGLNVRDQAQVIDYVARHGLADRVTLVSGADELAMDLVSRWLARRNGVRPRVRVEYSEPDRAREIPPMESHPLVQTLDTHLDLAGATKVGEGEAADAILYVAVPQKTPRPPAEEQRQAEASIVTRLLQLLEQGTPVAVADLVYINRADPGLVALMMERVPLCRLDAYAGWNTASNALGTAIAQLVAHRVFHRAGTGAPLGVALESEKTQQAFLFARLVDEYWYQAVLRDEVRPEYGSVPENADPLLNLLGPAGVKVRSELIPWAQELFRRHFLGCVVALPLPGRAARPARVLVEAVFPWQRVFEIEVRADMTLEPCEASPGPPPGAPDGPRAPEGPGVRSGD